MVRLLLMVCWLLPATGAAEEFSDAEAWRRACAEQPELKQYRPLFLVPRPFDDLMAWVPEGKTVRVWDENCKPIDLQRHEGLLAGDVEIKTSFHKGIKRVSARTAHFGNSVSYTGPGWTEYEKDARGRWQEVGGGGMGCLENRHGVLGQVTEDSAHYGGTEVTLKVVCRAHFEESGTCADGSPRSCKRCTALQVEAKSESPVQMIWYARGPIVRQGSSQPLDCSKPCPLDELSPRRERLNRFLEGKRFVSQDGLGDGAALFRSKKACRRHRRGAGSRP